jgi:cytochrome c oxidase assembly factor CtaG
MSESVSEALMEWNWQPSIVIGLALLVVAYLGAAGVFRDRFPESRPVPRAQLASFLAGAFTLLFALVSPLDEISDHYLFSAHMVQHLLLTLVAPPLLLMGTPGWILRPLLRYRAVYRACRILTMPILAFALFNLNFLIWHVPFLYEATLENENIHIVEHLLFISTAILNWWPILSSLAEWPRLPYPAQILYLFLDAVPSTVLGAILVFAPEVLYPTYKAAPPIFGISALDDQVMSGLIMAMPGGMVYLIALSIIFFVWLGREDRREPDESTVQAQPHESGSNPSIP